MKEPQGIGVRAFNVAYNGIANQLVSEVGISQAFDHLTTSNIPPMKSYKAIWDTGASNSVVTQTVVGDCGLQPTGVTKVNTAKGEDLSNLYVVGIWLPNKVCVPTIRVTEGKISGGIDVLIGMDIISQGDFAVTNKDGKTNFTFRLPSLECLDFVKQQPPTIQTGNNTLRRVGRNEPCTCGSGKKYKKCHGK